MGRRYVVTEANFTAVATMDLVQIKNASGSHKTLKIHRWWWRPTDNSLATAQVLMTRCRRLPSTVTDGSGGATPTPRPVDGGDAASTFSALTRNTTPATTNGTAVIEDEGGGHIYNGYEQVSAEGITIADAQSFVFELTSAAVQGAPKISVGVEVEEIG